MYNSKKYKAMADKSAEKERLFNEVVHKIL